MDWLLVKLRRIEEFDNLPKRKQIQAGPLSPPDGVTCNIRGPFKTQAGNAILWERLGFAI